MRSPIPRSAQCMLLHCQSIVAHPARHSRVRRRLTNHEESPEEMTEDLVVGQKRAESLRLSDPQFCADHMQGHQHDERLLLVPRGGLANGAQLDLSPDVRRETRRQQQTTRALL